MLARDFDAEAAVRRVRAEHPDMRPSTFYDLELMHRFHTEQWPLDSYDRVWAAYCRIVEETHQTQSKGANA